MCPRCEGSRRVPCFAGSMLCPACNGVGRVFPDVEAVAEAMSQVVRDGVAALKQLFEQVAAWMRSVEALVADGMPREVVDLAQRTMEGPRVLRTVERFEQANEAREITRGEYHASRLRA